MQSHETSALDSPGQLEFILNRIEKNKPSENTTIKFTKAISPVFLVAPTMVSR